MLEQFQRTFCTGCEAGMPSSSARKYLSRNGFALVSNIWTKVSSLHINTYVQYIIILKCTYFCAVMKRRSKTKHTVYATRQQYDEKSRTFSVSFHLKQTA